jgi:hypothetical protein
VTYLSFTQFLFPTGQSREIETDVPVLVYDKAMKIKEAGYRFEIERLSNGKVSITISDDEADWAHEIIDNGPAVPDAIERLIMNFKIPEDR